MKKIFIHFESKSVVSTLKASFPSHNGVNVELAVSEGAEITRGWMVSRVEL